MQSATLNTIPTGVASDRQVTLLEEHLQVLDAHLQSASQAATRLSAIADRLLGPKPEEISKGAAGTPDAQALAVRVERRARYLTPILAELHEQISRFERL